MQDPKNRQKLDIWAPSHNLSGCIFATKACIDNRKKNLLNGNVSPTCPYNMVNFSPLAAEIVSLVLGTPANVSRFRVLAALLHGTLAVGVSQTAALNRGRHLYLAALAHILVVFILCCSTFLFISECAFVVLGFVFPYQAKRLAQGMSPK